MYLDIANFIVGISMIGLMFVTDDVKWVVRFGIIGLLNLICVLS